MPMRFLRRQVGGRIRKSPQGATWEGALPWRDLAVQKGTQDLTSPLCHLGGATFEKARASSLNGAQNACGWTEMGVADRLVVYASILYGG